MKFTVRDIQTRFDWPYAIAYAFVIVFRQLGIVREIDRTRPAQGKGKGQSVFEGDPEIMTKGIADVIRQLAEGTRA